MLHSYGGCARHPRMTARRGLGGEKFRDERERAGVRATVAARGALFWSFSGGEDAFDRIVRWEETRAWAALDYAIAFEL